MIWFTYIRRICQKAKRLVEWPIFFVFDNLALLGSGALSSQNQKTAVVHLELLGDFFIWLPYGQAIVRKISADFEGDSVIIVDVQLEEFAKLAFPGCFVLPISRREMLHSPHFRWRTLRMLRKLRVTRSFNPSAPRDGLLQDAIIHALGAPALGFDSVFGDRPWMDIAISRHFYRQLVPDLRGVHQQVRYRRFLDVMGSPSVQPAILPNYQNPMGKRSYFVVAPGGSRAFRQWPAEHFAKLALRILQSHSDWGCIIVGDNNEHELAERVREMIGGETINLCGCTKIPELCAWIAHAQLVICNDSAPGHIAAAYGTPSLVITGGGHWRRCYPYDEMEAPIRIHPLCVSNPMPCFGCNWVCQYSLQDNQPFRCISTVTVEAAWQLLECHLPRQQNVGPTPDEP